MCVCVCDGIGCPTMILQYEMITSRGCRGQLIVCYDMIQLQIGLGSTPMLTGFPYRSATLRAWHTDK